LSDIRFLGIEPNASRSEEKSVCDDLCARGVLGYSYLAVPLETHPVTAFGLSDDEFNYVLGKGIAW
jgi:hypothetical protein